MGLCLAQDRLLGVAIDHMWLPKFKKFSASLSSHISRIHEPSVQQLNSASLDRPSIYLPGKYLFEFRLVSGTSWEYCGELETEFGSLHFTGQFEDLPVVPQSLDNSFKCGS